MAAELLKDHISPAVIQQIAKHCQQHYPAFAVAEFTDSVITTDFAELALTERVQKVATKLGQYLPPEFASACAILYPVSSQFSGLVGFIFPDFVRQFGLKHLETSLAALGHFTQFSTSEFAIRPFLESYPARTLEQLMSWAGSDNVHLRRLASEGCRPRLPWGKALPAFKRDPRPILPILAKLTADPEDYVRRSVANNLNDISKDHPELALDLAASWAGTSAAADWIVKHAMRGLLKQRHPRALALFGYRPLAVTAELMLANEQIAFGDKLEFSATLQIPADSGKIRVEYAIDFASAKGQLRHKVFQWLERSFTDLEWQGSRSYSFIDLTTRKHYGGLHKIHLIVNGQIMCSRDFVLTKRN